MGFLVTLLPGLRELRAPLTSGLLWLSVVVLTSHLNLPSATTDVMGQSVGNLSVIVVPATVVGGSFLLGILAQTLVAPIVGRMGYWARRLVLRVESYGTYYRLGELTILSFEMEKISIPKGLQTIHRKPRWFYRMLRNLQLDSWPLSQPAQSLLINATTNRLVSAGVPGAAALSFPSQPVARALPYCAPQLAQVAPIQYQEFDRLRAEAELRIAIAPPIIALAVALPGQSKPLLVAISVIAGIVLLLQGALRLRSSMDILANAAYLGYVDVPVVVSVVEGLKALPIRPENEPQWSAAIIASLHDRGFFGESATALAEEFEDRGDDLGHLAEIGSYLAAHNSSMHRVWASRYEQILKLADHSASLEVDAQGEEGD